ncbi:monocarboxylate transporter 12-like [Pecten maximus]|uniref:monocarboxylate transporter 12-like n=1 Tax=Pecten maximus TaxID=6579 RepID=UPI001458C323|nr:monocarboxylate transporter 12-like [Pecten maximus]
MSKPKEIQEDNLSHFLPDRRERFGDEDCELPIDQGWAWVVLAASTFINTIYAGVLKKSFGIFFVEILDVYGGTVSTTSLILGLQFTVYCIANVPVLMILLRYQSVRRCQLVGIILSALGYALSSLTNRLELLILCQSVLNGLSCALIVPTSIVQVSKYFRKRIGLANGILMAGFSLGGLVMPPMIQFIVREYTLHGALLLTSGIIFNALPAAVLQRPPEFYRRILKRKDHLGGLQHIISSDSKDTNDHNKMDQPLISESGNQLKSKMSISEATLSTIALNNKIMKRGELDLQLATNSLPNLLHSGSLFGLMSGVLFAISNPLLKEIVGDEDFAAAIGIAIFTKSVVLCVMVPLLGYLRDATCTYHVTFHCMGATSCVAVCILILFGVVFPKHSS